MRIVRLETYLVPPRWCLLKIETDAGITGWGEPVVEGRAHTVAELVGEMADYLIGKDPGPIEDHWNVLYRGGYYRGGVFHMSALAGIDQALWDIKGKSLGQPVHVLLGGPVRDRVQVYASVRGSSREELARQALDHVRKGLKFLKMNATEAIGFIASNAAIDEAVARVDAVRSAVGPEIGLGIDIHGRAHRGVAKALVSALEQFRPVFIEEPVLGEHAAALSGISRLTSAQLALGERLCSRWEFRPLLESGHVDVIQPDPSHAGGITETRKIAAMAECHDVGVALHCPHGPVSLAACLQLDGICYNAQLQEQRLGLHDPDAPLPYVMPQCELHYADGMVAIPTRPGLGIEIDADAVHAAASEGHRWRNPLWRHGDGSLAEW
ncbi:MAG: galactonate dehydratase [Boseongicola sp.]|nr:galactonate dehydratase [Boseongicola sp.]